MIGDFGTIVEAYSDQGLAFEVECCDPIAGVTVWLETMYPEELIVTNDLQL
jgi:hypothetical protein